MFILVSSVCRSLQCLISILTKGGEGGHLLRLTCSVVLWGGRNTANKYHWHVWGVLVVYRPHGVCPSSRWPVLSQSTLLRLQVALQGNCPKLALHFMHFPGLSCSDLGRAQNACAVESVSLWNTREPEPEQLRPGKRTQPRACFSQFPCRAT